MKKDVNLIRRPLEVIRPERNKPNTLWVPDGPLDAINLKENCPLSFLATLQGVDDEESPAGCRARGEMGGGIEAGDARRGVADRELARSTARLQDQPGGPITKVVFSCPVPEYHLTITKTYELVKVDGDPATEPDANAYHLVLSLQVTNNDTKKHDVAYRLDGPNGLPVEGSWYVTSKVGRTWSAEGLRDVVYQFAKSEAGVATASQLSEKDKFYKEIAEASQFSEHPPQFFGVDAQYFSVAMLPDAKSTAGNLERAVALRMGDVVEMRKTLTNTSFRLISKSMSLEASGGKSPPQHFEVFAGPKRPQLLANYKHARA